MIKRIISLICCALMLTIMGTNVYAASSPVVFAEKTTTEEGKDVLIPVKIKNNAGITGMHFVVEYDPEKVKVTNVTQGDIITQGVFDQNLNKKKGKFDIVWAGIENITEDGVLFNLYIRADKEFDGKTSIKLSYVQKDTYNEQFENVYLDCQIISVKSGSSKTDDKNSQQEETENSETSFYAKEIKDEIRSKLDDETVLNIVDEELKESGVSSIDELDPKQQKDLLNKLISAMDEKGADTSRIKELLKKTDTNKELDDSEVITKAVSGIYTESKKTADSDMPSIDVNETVGKPSFSKLAMIVLGIIAVIAVIICYLDIKRRRDQK